MQFRLSPAVLALASLALVACDDDDDPTGPSQVANVRVVNASSTTANASVSVGTTSLGSVAFRSGSTNCFQVPAGSQTLSFSSGGSAVASTAPFTFQAGQDYTVVLFGNGATRTATVYTDNFTAAAAGMNQLRFVNATTTAGDVFVTTPAGAVTGTPSAALAAGAATTGGTAGFLSFPVANTRVRLFNTGVTTGAARADLTLTALPTSRTTTVVFVEPGTPAGAPAFTVNSCE